MKLSLGQAWDETKAMLARNGSLIAVVALALLVLPGALTGLFAPPRPDAPEPSTAMGVLGLVTTLIGLAGQLAISRIALGPSVTVGEAIRIGFVRLPAFFGAMLLVALPIVLFVLTPLMIAGGGELPDDPPPALALMLLLVFPLVVYVLVRLLPITPLAVDSRLGPVGLLRQSWGLTKGHAGRLFLLVLLVLLAGIVLVVGLGGGLGAVTILFLGAPEPGNFSALIIALVTQLLNAVVSVVFGIMIARLYVQLTQSAAPAASVPHAGEH